MKLSSLPLLLWSNPVQDDPPLPEDDENKEKRTDDISSWDADFLKVSQAAILVMTIFIAIFITIFITIFIIILITCSGGPGHPVRADPGRQLPRHQGAPRRHLQDRRQHDQGSVTFLSLFLGVSVRPV